MENVKPPARKKETKKEKGKKLERYEGDTDWVEVE